jgi:membrane protease YdiL (CAAX protease family)
MSKNTRGILVFCLIAFGIGWLNLLLIWLLMIRPAPDPQAAMLNPFLVVLAGPFAFAPAIAAFVVRRWVTREGFSDAGLRLRLRPSWPYYLCAFLFPLIVLPVALGVWALVRAGQPELSAPLLGTILPMLPMGLAMTPLLFGEEFGWRGYLQLRLAPERPLLSAIGTGLIWSVWHLPLLLMGFSDINYALAMLAHVVTAVLLSIFYGWLQVRSESVWPASLAHAVGNYVFIGSLGLLLSEIPSILAWGGYGAVGAAVLAALTITVGRFGARAPQQTDHVSS